MTDRERTSFRVQFGDRLRMCRKRQRFTQTQLGKSIGQAQTVISQWENGNCLPSLVHFIQLLTALDVKPKALLGRRYERLV